MSFLDQIFASLDKNGDSVVLQELREGTPAQVTARELLAQVQVARAYLRRLRLKRGIVARCLRTTPSGGWRWIWRSWPKG